MTTGTSTSRGCCSCRSGSPRSRTSCGRAAASSAAASCFHEAEVDRVEIEHDEVVLLDGDRARLRRAGRRHRGVRLRARGDRGAHRARAGTSGSSPSTTPDGAEALARCARAFDGGRLVVNVVDMPIKCPVAPLEFCFLADWYFRERGIRDRTELVYATPLDGAFTKPIALAAPRRACSREKEIELVTEFNTGEVDGVGGTLGSLRRPRGRLRPARDGPAARRRRVRRPLARARRRARLRPHRRGARCSRRSEPNIFAIGDATDLPTSKAGSVTHFEGEILDREHRALLRRRGARARLRRPRELLHRDRLPQGAADRLQLRDRAAARPLPDRVRRCRCCRSRGSTTSASSRSSGSTGTRCCPAARSPASARPCRPPARRASCPRLRRSTR